MFNGLFHSLIFAQISGLYLLIMAIIMLLRRDFYRHFAANLKPASGTIIVAASFALILGLMMIVIHNIWVLEPQLLITIIGWIIVIQSILWLTLPERMIYLTRVIYRGKGYYFVVVFTALIGIFLITKGFYPYM